MSSSFALHPHPTVRRYSNLARAARPSAMAGAVILCAAILIAALSTVDPLWWHLHFSRLGMFADASGYTFNGGVVMSGLVIAAGSVPLAVHLAGSVAAGRVADMRAARMLPPLLVALGLSLALIGVVPLTLNEFLHDRAANGVLLSFLGLVIVSRRTMPELPAFLGRYAIATVIVLAVGIGLMVSGIINLAAFEVLAFGGVLSWVHLLERSVRTLAAEAKALEAIDDTVELSAPACEVSASGAPARHLVCRGARVHASLTATRPATARAASIRALRVAHIEHELLVPPEAEPRRQASRDRLTAATSRPRGDALPAMLRDAGHGVPDARRTAPVALRTRAPRQRPRAPRTLRAPSPAYRG